MYKKIFTSSLFPLEKGEFNPAAFEQLLNDYPFFVKWLKDSITVAYDRLNSIDEQMSKRLRSTNLHEFIFNELKNKLSDLGENADKIEINTSIAGNQKNYLSFGNYIFILRKNNSTINDTSVSEYINNQTAPNHIITIEYTMSQMQYSIVSLRLVYYIDNSSMYTYSIPLSSIDPNEMPSKDVNVIVPTKPKLSEKVMRRKNIS